MKTGVIYKFTNKLNNLSYIGQTIYPEKRKLAHERCSSTDKFHTALRYYGLMNFDYDIIEDNVPEDKLDEREVYWINYYDSYNNGYNSTLGEDQYIKKFTNRMKIKNGELNRLPFGYKFDKNHKPIKDKKNAQIVKDIFDKYINGLNLRELSTEYGMCVQNILNNKKYYNKSNGLPPIITEDIFNAARNNRRNRPRRNRRTHILKGILYDNNNNLYTTNNAAKCFLPKKGNKGNNVTLVSYKNLDLLITVINPKYDKIIVTPLKRYIKKFNIYYEDKHIQTVIIDSYNKVILENQNNI